MRTIMTTALAAALALPALASAPLAQEAAPAEPPAQSRPGAPEGGVAGEITLDSLVGWIETSDTIAERVSRTEAFNNVDVATIGSDADASIRSRIEEAVASNAAKVDELRAAIRGREALSRRLEAVGLRIDHIVAARLSREGDLLLFMGG